MSNTIIQQRNINQNEVQSVTQSRAQRRRIRRRQLISQTNKFTFDTNWEERVDNFEEMDLKPELLRGIYNLGFKKPLDIQAMAIKPIFMGKYTMMQSPYGFFPFVIGILNKNNTGTCYHTNKQNG